MSWLLWLGLTMCLLALAAVGVSVVGARRWSAEMRVMAGQLDAGRIGALQPEKREGEQQERAPPTRYDARELDDLPAPVQRYFRAVLKDGPLSVTLLFRFNEEGLIGSFRAEARGGMVGDKMVMAPWEGIWSNYQWRDGVQVPFTGEVAWIRPEGRKPYFVGTVTSLALEFSR